MFEFLRNWGLTAEEKRQEVLNAYLDGGLTPAERQGLEVQLASDPALRAEFDQLQFVKQQLGNLPQRRVPRPFSLDPAVYGRPASQTSSSLYPVLRGATALASLAFVFLLGLSLVQGNLGAPGASPASQIAQSEAAPQEELAFEAAVAVTRVITEDVAEEALEMAGEAAVEEAVEAPAVEQLPAIGGGLPEETELAPLPEAALDLAAGAADGVLEEEAAREALESSPAPLATQVAAFDEATIELAPATSSNGPAADSAAADADAFDVESANSAESAIVAESEIATSEAQATQAPFPQRTWLIGLGILSLVLLLLTILARGRRLG